MLHPELGRYPLYCFPDYQKLDATRQIGSSHLRGNCTFSEDPDENNCQPRSYLRMSRRCGIIARQSTAPRLRISLRRIQLELRSIARCETRSTLRPSIVVSSSSIAERGPAGSSPHLGRICTGPSRCPGGNPGGALTRTREVRRFSSGGKIQRASPSEWGCPSRMPFSLHQFATTGRGGHRSGVTRMSGQNRLGTGQRLSSDSRGRSCRLNSATSAVS